MKNLSSTFRREATRTLLGAVVLTLVGGATLAPAANADSLGNSSTGSTSVDNTDALIIDMNSPIGKYYKAHKAQVGRPIIGELPGILAWDEDRYYSTEAVFTRGRVVSSEVGGVHFIDSRFDKVYQANGGSGSVGVPVDEQHYFHGVYVQDFVESDRDDPKATPTIPSDSIRSVIVWDKNLGIMRFFKLSQHKNMTYEALGGARGSLGLPTSNATPMGQGTVQSFEKGVMTDKYGIVSHTVFYGRMYDAWSASGAGTGAWGFPMKEATTLPDGSVEQYFQHKLAHVSPSGKVTVKNFSRTYVNSRKDTAENAGLGPKWREGVALEPADGRRVAHDNYEGGIVLTPTDSRGAVAVSEEVSRDYNNFDAAHQARLGDPVSFTYDSKLGLTTHFEHGSLRYDEKTKKVVETK